MPTYIIFSILAATSFALSLVFNKFISKHKIDNPNALMTYFMLSCLSFAVFLFPFAGRLVFSLSFFEPLLIATITFLIGYYLFFVGIFKTDASVFAPLFQFQAVIVALFAFVFLGERFPLQNYLCISLVIGGAILVTLDEKMNIKSFLKPGVLIFLAMQLLHAVSNLYIGFTLQKINFLQVLFWEYLVIGLSFFPFALLAKPRLGYPLKTVSQFFIATYLSSVGALLLFRAFEENLTISSSIALMSSPIVFIISFFASRFKPDLLEHHSSKVYLIRLVGILIILFGIFKMSVS